jgi:hypothetical protein
MRQWHNTEDRILADNYQPYGREIVQKVLLMLGFRRTKRAVISRAHKLGVKKGIT